jgi:hypothetical protein
MIIDWHPNPRPNTLLKTVNEDQLQWLTELQANYPETAQSHNQPSPAEDFQKDRHIKPSHWRESESLW